MAPPKGNKYAKGNPNSGRPPKYDLDQEAKELLEWSFLDSSTSLYQFTKEKPYLAQELTDFAKRSDVFRLALKKAKENIGMNREHHVNDEMMNYGVWARSARLYDTLLDDLEEYIEEKKHKRNLEKIEFEIKKKKEADIIVSEEISTQFNHLMKQITRLQTKS